MTTLAAARLRRDAGLPVLVVDLLALAVPNNPAARDWVLPAALDARNHSSTDLYDSHEPFW